MSDLFGLLAARIAPQQINHKHAIDEWCKLLGSCELNDTRHGRDWQGIALDGMDVQHGLSMRPRNKPCQLQANAGQA
jgi:hypothetical protein